MKALVSHLWRTNRAEIVAQSRRNCHVVGLHSIMLLHAPGKTIRLFVAEPYHTLGRNLPATYEQGMSVAFHPHHCELTLACVLGTITNWVVEQRLVNWTGSLQLTPFAYRSALRAGGECSFEQLGTAKPFTTEYCVEMASGATDYLRAETIHTVGVRPNEEAAWFVFEGREDPHYQNVCFSTSDLRKHDASSLYQPISEAGIEILLCRSGLL